MTLPPPSRSLAVEPASELGEPAGRIFTRLAPAPMIFTGLVMVRPFIAPSATGFASLFTGLDDSLYTPGQTTMVSHGLANSTASWMCSNWAFGHWAPSSSTVHTLAPGAVVTLGISYSPSARW